MDVGGCLPEKTQLKGWMGALDYIIMLHALAYKQCFPITHNANLREGGIIGDLIWEGIDHNRGYYPKSPVSKSGIFDVFRVPKLSYQFVRSQKKALTDGDYVIYLNALKWETKNKLVFFSNCERLELYGDNQFIASSTCDRGPDRPFHKRSGKPINDHYWMTKEDHIVTSQKFQLVIFQ